MGNPMRVTDSALATLPAAAGVTMLLAQVLPLEFQFRPNGLGITSATILARYPTQQETFWFGFAIAVTAVLAWLAQQTLRRRAFSVRREMGLEIMGVAVLLAALTFPAPLNIGVVAALLMAAALLVLRSPREAPNARPPLGTPGALQAGGEARPSRRRWTLWIATILIVASVYSADPYSGSGFWGGVANVIHDVSDRDLMVDSFEFKGERGQHLLWADALRNGDLPGRDFFSLYGPLYELSIVGIWSLLGRSVASVTLFEGLVALCGMATLLLLALRLVRYRFTILVIPLLTPYASLRMGLGFLGLFCLVQWLGRGKTGWCAAAGVIGGVALVFSQEYGLAFLAVSVAAIVLAGQWRAGGLFIAGWAMTLLPVVVWLARADALEPMLDDLLAYPSYILAGYANLPFPSLVANLPLGLGFPRGVDQLMLRLAYIPPLILVGGLLMALPLRHFKPAAPMASLGRIRRELLADPVRLGIVLVALYGVLCFRSALGRSDAWHFLAALPPVALLLCVALDRCVDLFRARETDLRLRALWRTAALLFLVLQSGMPQAARPVEQLKRSAFEIANLLRGEPKLAGDPRGLALLEWLRRHTRAEDRLFFGPGNPAFYYLAERPNPTRFATPYLMVTDAHRAEALADLRADPPRFIVWDEELWVFDDLSMPIVLGSNLLKWIDRNYTPAVSNGGFSLRRYKAGALQPRSHAPTPRGP
jgi:hypothetical protein